MGKQRRRRPAGRAPRFGARRQASRAPPRRAPAACRAPHAEQGGRAARRAPGRAACPQPRVTASARPRDRQRCDGEAAVRFPSRSPAPRGRRCRSRRRRSPRWRSGACRRRREARRCRRAARRRAARGCRRRPAARPRSSLSPSSGDAAAGRIASSVGVEPARFAHRVGDHRVGRGGDRRRLLDQRRGEIVADQLGHAELGVVGLELIFADAAIDDVARLVDRQDLRLVHLLEDVAQAQHHDLVADDQHPPVGMVEADRVERAAQAQDDVGPALAAGRAVGRICRAGRDARRGRDVSGGCRWW